MSSQNQEESYDALPGDISTKLPAIAEDEENQNVIQVPGLAEELNKLEKSYAQIQLEKDNRAAGLTGGRNSKLSNNVFSERSNSVMSKHATMNDYLEATDVPMTRKEFDEVTAKPSDFDKRQSPAFTAVGRENKLLRQAYLDTKDGAEASKYSPKYEFV